MFADCLCQIYLHIYILFLSFKLNICYSLAHTHTHTYICVCMYVCIRVEVFNERKKKNFKNYFTTSIYSQKIVYSFTYVFASTINVSNINNM